MYTALRMCTCAEKKTFLGKDDQTIVKWGRVIMGLRATLPNHIPACGSEFFVQTQNVFGTQNIFDPNFIWPKRFLTQNLIESKSFLELTLFWTLNLFSPIFLDLKVFGLEICFDPNIFVSRIFLTKNIFLPIVLPPIYWNPKFIGTLNLFGPYFFWNDICPGNIFVQLVRIATFQNILYTSAVTIQIWGKF